MKILILLLIINIICFSDNSFAQPYEILDESFGSDGLVTTEFGSADAQINAVKIQADGKIVAVGVDDAGLNRKVAIARYNTNGTLDNSFNNDGKITTDIGTGGDEGHALLIQVDGKIIIGGFTVNGTNSDFLIVKYNSDGSFDTDFGINGVVTTDFGTDNDYALSAIVQSDGKIVLAGYSTVSSDEVFALARYNVEGSLDSSFGTDGKVTTLIGFEARAYSITLQSDGKIVAVGDTYGGFAVARYNTNGSLDNSFSNDGIEITSFSGDQMGARGVGITADGKIAVGGYLYEDVGGGLLYGVFALAQYNSNGTLDTNFGISGKVTTIVANDFATAFGLMIQANGQIVMVGTTGSVFGLARYNMDGSPDTSFSADGTLATDFSSSGSAAFCVAEQSDGKIVAAGSSTVFPASSFALARYTNGLVDNLPGIQTSFIASSVYPNPTPGYCILKILDKVYEIEILNSVGQLVKTLTVHGQKQIELFFENNGVYFIQLRTPQHIYREKLIVSSN